MPLDIKLRYKGFSLPMHFERRGFVYATKPMIGGKTIYQALFENLVEKRPFTYEQIIREARAAHRTISINAVADAVSRLRFAVRHAPDARVRAMRLRQLTNATPRTTIHLEYKGYSLDIQVDFRNKYRKREFNGKTLFQIMFEKLIDKKVVSPRLMPKELGKRARVSPVTIINFRKIIAKAAAKSSDKILRAMRFVKAPTSQPRKLVTLRLSHNGLSMDLAVDSRNQFIEKKFGGKTVFQLIFEAMADRKPFPAEQMSSELSKHSKISVGSIINFRNAVISAARNSPDQGLNSLGLRLAKPQRQKKAEKTKNPPRPKPAQPFDVRELWINGAIRGKLRIGVAYNFDELRAAARAELARHGVNNFALTDEQILRVAGPLRANISEVRQAKAMQQAAKATARPRRTKIARQQAARSWQSRARHRQIVHA